MLCAYYARFIIVKVMERSTLDMGETTYTMKLKGALGRQSLCELNGCVNCEAWSSECFKKLRKSRRTGTGFAAATRSIHPSYKFLSEQAEHVPYMYTFRILEHEHV